MVHRFGWISPLSRGLVWSQSLRIVDCSFMYSILLAARPPFQELEPAKIHRAHRFEDLDISLILSISWL
jgi:hypothetical protein